MTIKNSVRNSASAFHIFGQFLRYTIRAAFFFILLSAASIFAEENPQTVYVIREIDYDITGRSHPYYLNMYGDFTEGERIQGEENLENYLARKIQLLNNQRVLDDEFTAIDYFLGGPEPDGALPVKLLVHVTDTNNLIILPYPKYDSNDGFSLTLKARDYNFLGTMSPLRIDLGWRLDDKKKNHFNFMIDSDTPFQAFNLDWNINFDHDFRLTLGQPLYYQNVSGLSFKVPVKSTTITTGFNHYLTFNEEIPDEYRDVYTYTDEYYRPYGATEIFSGWNIPLGIEIGDYGQLSYTPGLSARINYPYGKMDLPHKPSAVFSQSIGFGRIDWIGNYRKGLSVSIENSNTWYFDRSDAPLAVGLNAEAVVYWPFNKYIGAYSRLKYRQWWQWSDTAGRNLPYYSGGDVIRGVWDNDIRADYMLSLNFDLPIRVLKFWPSEWFENRKLHIFDFEMHLSPFLDLAMFEGPYSKLKDPSNPWAGKTDFGFSDLIPATGIEIIVFPAIFRSFIIRGSIGYDINKIRKNGLKLKGGFFPEYDEIFIGVDLFY